ncbi:MAG: amidohydrolase family protein, partial [Chloroflexota bacterium]
LMHRIGMSPMETSVATTKKAAECLGWESNVGTLNSGKWADVIITEVNPLEDIASLKDVDNIKLVLKDGKIVKDIRQI